MTIISKADERTLYLKEKIIFAARISSSPHSIHRTGNQFAIVQGSEKNKIVITDKKITLTLDGNITELSGRLFKKAILGIPATTKEGVVITLFSSAQHGESLLVLFQDATGVNRTPRSLYTFCEKRKGEEE